MTRQIDPARLPALLGEVEADLRQGPTPTVAAPISEDGGQSPLDACGSGQGATPPRIPDSPAGSFTVKAPKRCSPSWRESSSVNALDAPAWLLSVPAVNAGLKRPLGHAPPPGPESISRFEVCVTAGVPLHGVKRVL